MRYILTRMIQFLGSSSFKTNLQTPPRTCLDYSCYCDCFAMLVAPNRLLCWLLSTFWDFECSKIAYLDSTQTSNSRLCANRMFDTLLEHWEHVRLRSAAQIIRLVGCSQILAAKVRLAGGRCVVELSGPAVSKRVWKRSPASVRTYRIWQERKCYDLSLCTVVGAMHEERLLWSREWWVALSARGKVNLRFQHPRYRNATRAQDVPFNDR
jgi:hypothetical protein